MRLDLADLRLFIAIVDTGSITGGAANAHLALASASDAPLTGMASSALRISVTVSLFMPVIATDIRARDAIVEVRFY